MSAKIVTVSPTFMWTPPEVQRLWFFPEGSRFHSRPHFHAIFPGGFRQNLPLWTCFVVVLEGKLSVKNFDGETVRKVLVQDQIWWHPNSERKAQVVYSWMFHKPNLPIKERV